MIGEGLYIGACLRVLLDPERLTGMKVSSSASSAASENWVRTPYLFWEESTEIFLAGISFSVGDLPDGKDAHLVCNDARASTIMVWFDW